MNYSYSNPITSTYENIIADCPNCNHHNIYNRITDLQTRNPISFKTVECDKCNQKFNINGDSIGEAYEYLIFDVYFMKEQKRYMYCILNLAQAIESFLFYTIRVKLLFLPHKNCYIDSTKRLNLISSKISEVMKKYTFHPLRNIFFELYINHENFLSIDNINDFLRTNNLKKIKNRDTASWYNEINNLSDLKRKSLFSKLLNTKVPELRNKVVHKYSYRPSLEEVEQSITETRDIVFRLKDHLDIRDHFHYLN